MGVARGVWERGAAQEADRRWPQEPCVRGMQNGKEAVQGYRGRGSVRSLAPAEKLLNGFCGRWGWGGSRHGPPLHPEPSHCGLFYATGSSTTLVTYEGTLSLRSRRSEVAQISSRSPHPRRFLVCSSGHDSIALSSRALSKDVKGTEHAPHPIAPPPPPHSGAMASSNQYPPNAGATWASSLLVFPGAGAESLGCGARAKGERWQSQRRGTGEFWRKSVLRRLLCLGAGSTREWCARLSQRHSWQVRLWASQRRSRCRSGRG